jgi:hypothetical protein
MTGTPCTVVVPPTVSTTHSPSWSWTTTAWTSARPGSRISRSDPDPMRSPEVSQNTGVGREPSTASWAR